MKRLIEIKNEYALEDGFEDWSDLLNNISPEESIYDEISKRYAKQVAEQALKDAASGCQYVACINEYVNEKSCIETTPIKLP